MREVIEFRIPEESARRVFGPNEGTVLADSVRKIELAATDKRLALIRDAEAEYSRRGEAFLTSWNVTRYYSEQELDSAELLQLCFTRMFEPAGEECGTQYSESEACPVCGAGAAQLGNLRLDLRRLPKGADIARSIADEWVVSQRLGELLLESHLTGFELRPVLHRNAPVEMVDLRAVQSGQRLIEAAEASGIAADSGEYWVWLNRTENQAAFEAARVEAESLADPSSKPVKGLPVWHQLRITAPSVPVASLTRFGIDLFDEDPEGDYRCPLGHVAGLNLLSELHVQRECLPGTDLAVTRELVGNRRGLLRPAPLLLVSQAVRNVLTEHGIKGYRLEIAQIVDGSDSRRLR